MPERAGRFNGSEYNAWLSGTGLKVLLLNLKAKGYNVNVLAHSQGNIPMAQAFREAADEHLPPPLVNAYVASQAAVSGSLYSASAANCLTSRNIQPITPIDALGHYPLGDPGEQSYMAGTSDYSGKWINLYNNEDYAVGDDTRFPELVAIGTASAWEYNDQHIRPQKGGPIYWYDDQANVFRENARALDPAVPKDRFLIFSKAAQSWGSTIGSGPVAPFSDPTLQVDLAFALVDGQNNQTLHKAPYEHDGQFMYSMAKRWIYWDKLLSTLGVGYKTWMTNPKP